MLDIRNRCVFFDFEVDRFSNVLSITERRKIGLWNEARVGGKIIRLLTDRVSKKQNKKKWNS